MIHLINSITKLIFNISIIAINHGVHVDHSLNCCRIPVSLQQLAFILHHFRRSYHDAYQLCYCHILPQLLSWYYWIYILSLFQHRHHIICPPTVKKSVYRPSILINASAFWLHYQTLNNHWRSKVPKGWIDYINMSLVLLAIINKCQLRECCPESPEEE